MVDRSKSPESNPISRREIQNSNKNFGIYIGRVVKTKDEYLNGRLAVNIPAIHKDSTSYFVCKMSSPFAGSKSKKTLGTDKKADPANPGTVDGHDFRKTITSYGFWATPPDEDNLVLVAFADGNISMPYIIGCLHLDDYHYMVPGMPAGPSYTDTAMLAPVAERNPLTSETGGTTNEETQLRPIHFDLAESITKQGLINDPLRGAGTSGSRRGETPSEVFGILTPGALNPSDTEYGSRFAGHQFIMDDNIAQSGIRLRTGKGSQILLNDVTNTVYMINKNGDCWFEMDALGNMHFYAERSVNIRTNGNFNLRADGQVNIEAGGDLNLKAAGDMRGNQYVGGLFQEGLAALGLPAAGTGGRVNITAKQSIQAIGDRNVAISAGGGDIDINAGNAIKIQSSGVDPLSQSGIALSAYNGQDVGITSTKNIKMTAPYVGVNSPVIQMGGGVIMLNTGTPLPALPCVAQVAFRLNGTPKDDVSTETPPFNREAAISGESSAFPTAGRRPKEESPKYTIVSTLVTPEPYAGHAKYDPAKKASEPGFVDKFSGFPSNINPSSLAKTPTPSAMQLANGTVQQGIGYVDDAGNAINSFIDDAGAFSDDLAAQAQGLFEATDIVNNIFSSGDLSLASIQALEGHLSSLSSILPPIRFPSSNALEETIAGVDSILTELEAQLSMFGIDAEGLLADLASGQGLAALTNQIDDIAKAALNGEGAFADLLAEADIAVGKIGEVIDEATGAILEAGNTFYEDAMGNKLIDFSNGLTAEASLALKGASLSKTWDDISSSFPELPVTAGQATALADFASDIGLEQFANSNVGQTLSLANSVAGSNPSLSSSLMATIPSQMAGWVTTSSIPGGAKSISQDLVDKREYQASLFTSSDDALKKIAEVTVKYAPGENTFRQAATELTTSTFG